MEQTSYHPAPPPGALSSGGGGGGSGAHSPSANCRNWVIKSDYVKEKSE